MFKFTLENENGSSININDGIRYAILSVSGLNPPSASIFTAKSPNRKGSRYNGSTLNERNILMSIKILGDIERNRNDLYEWIDTEQYIKVYYQNGVKNVYCEGHIEDCEVELFTDNEVINLAILCENPYWMDLQAIATDISTLLREFTLPFAISASGIPFSTIREENTTAVYNSGAETGVKIVIKCKGEVKNLLLFNADDTSQTFKINYTFPMNWTIEINTDGSPKTCKGISPEGNVVNLLRYVGNNPTWFILKKGMNSFGYTADAGTSNAEVSITYANKYLGV